MMRLTALSAAHGTGHVPAPETGQTAVSADLLAEQGRTQLREMACGPVFRIAAFDLASCAKKLAPLGLHFPKPGRVATSPQGELIWFAKDEALLLASTCPDFGSAAAVSEIGDGFCHLRLEGPLALAALARLVPLDLRPLAFKADHCARTLLGKQDLLIRRAGDEAFDLMTARSMAQSAVDEIAAILVMLAAR